MNKIIFLTVFCITTLLLLFTACKKDCKKGNCKDDPCKIDRPKDVKPIDWENYNSVYDVFWNYYAESHEENVKIYQDGYKDIMIYGWVRNLNYGYINLYDFYLREYSNGNTCSVIIWGLDRFFDKTQIKLDTCDLTKKCFVKGKLSYNELQTNYCGWITPVIVDIDDIYFE